MEDKDKVFQMLLIIIVVAIIVIENRTLTDAVAPALIVCILESEVEIYYQNILAVESTFDGCFFHLTRMKI